MRALTLIRPWNYAFTCGKNIENRSWGCYLPPGTTIALHAGAMSGWDSTGAKFIESLGYSVPSKSDCASSVIFAVFTFQANVSSSTSKWFFGPVGWTFSDLFMLPQPVSCKGSLGLWRIPEPQLSEVIRQLQGVGC
jgi:hypothetical protein